MMHLVDCARGALKLYALHLRHPATVAPEQALKAGQEALERLELLDSKAYQLAELYRAVRALQPKHITVAVAPNEGEGKNLMVMLLDGPHLVETIYGNDPKAIAEIMRIHQQRKQEAA